jgi:hypothetical protein
MFAGLLVESDGHRVTTTRSEGLTCGGRGGASNWPWRGEIRSFRLTPLVLSGIM